MMLAVRVDAALNKLLLRNSSMLAIVASYYVEAHLLVESEM
jgi:hypothetical protein